MDLLIVRHAIAGDRDEWARSGRPDADRPLTPEGRKRMRESARGIRALVPRLDLLATSPFARAAQTAEILVAEYGDLTVMDLPVLAHGSAADEVSAWLAKRTEDCIGLVGHEPDLGTLISWFVTGASERAVPLKKGGAALLEFPGTPGRAQAELRWFLPPKVLRLLEPR